MTIINKSTSGAPVPRFKKVLHTLTPLQLAELRKGPKTTVLVGLDGDRFVGLEGASISLLAHFSPYARQKLMSERATTLCIPNGSKQPVTWIYKYMRAGETDAADQERFETLAFDKLVLIYTHSVFLHYQHLMDRVLSRLKGKYIAALPSIDDLKTFSNFIPPMYDYAIDVLAHEMANPWTCNYLAYIELAETDPKFSDALGTAVQKLLVHRVKVGTEYYKRTKNRQASFSNEYYTGVGKTGASTTTEEMKKSTSKYATKLATASDCRASAAPPTKAKRHQVWKPKTKKSTDSSVVAKEVQNVTSHELKKHTAKKAAKCFTSVEVGHLERNSKVVAQPQLVDPDTAKIYEASKTKQPFTCYNCGRDGHMARDCTVEVSVTKKKVKRPARICHNCNEKDHLFRRCTVDVKRSAPACYNCSQDGHLARDCTVARKEETHQGRTVVRNNTGRSEHFRRAQHDRAAFIDVVGKGDSLRTCIREVGQGEKTRTGLFI